MLTQTQIELHNAHKARMQRIAMAAARHNPPPMPKPKVIAAPVEPEQSKDEWADKQIEQHKRFWFSVVSAVKVTKEGGPTIRAIQLATCDVYGVKLNDLLSARRTANLIIPRHVSMYLAKEMTSLSHPRIARATGDRDHTVSMYACRKIEELLKQDEHLAGKIALIKERLA